ncbi:MAG: methyltransferase [Saprospiraceae bacterium]
MNYETLKAVIEQIRAGELRIEDLKKNFKDALASAESIKAEIDQAYTLAQLKRKIMTNRGKKADYVRGYYNALLDAFHVKDWFITYSFSKTYQEALTEAIEGQTQADLDKYVAERKKKLEATKKALTDPETLEEFRTFIRYKGGKALSKAQLAHYERLLADQELDAIQVQEERKATVKAVSLGEVGFELLTTKHTKKGHDLWVVKLTERVDKDKYQELNRKAKRLGGYYSSYAKGGAIPGFQFSSEESANQFMALKEGDVQQTEKIADKYDKKQNKVAAKLLTMADDWETGARDKFTQDRKENTARRARMARGARDDAEKAIYNAKVLRAVAEALEAGKIKYLARIDSAVQLETLRDILWRANYKRMIDQNVPSNDWKKDFEKDIDYVVYPYPWIHWETVYRMALALQGKKGQIMRGRRLEKAALNLKYHKTEKVVRFRGSLLEDLRAAAHHLNKYERERIQSAVSTYERIQRMKLNTLPLLKTALREYYQYAQVKALSPEEQREKEIKELENQFRREKIDGFFPTPRPLVIRMLELAGIEENDKILEPSAGLGHIADIITELHPDNELTLIEKFYPLAEALKKKGYEDAINADFLEQKGSYDKIIMNPPFEHLVDIDHVRHAYKLLKPGGRLVAIMAANKGEGASRRKVKDFREWLDEIGAYVEENPEGAFKSGFRPTGVRTITVAIDKEPGQEAPPVAEPERITEDPEPQLEPWQMRLKDYVYLRTGSRAHADKYFTKFLKEVSHWAGGWPVNKYTGHTWREDPASTLRYAREHRESVWKALREGKDVSKEVLKDQMMDQEDNERVSQFIRNIHTDEQRFQNRTDLNQTIVNEIAENYDPNQFDPIVIWRDPKDEKIYLLAGHHRLAGVKKRQKGGGMIAARWFKGSESKAITYAKELSNANRTLETPLERAGIYRTKLEKGEDKKKIRTQAEKLEGKNWRYVLNLAHLNPDGKTVNALLALVDNSDKATQQNLEKIADWIGEARRQFDALTNAHENEMYDFLLDNFKAKKPAITRKDLWIERVRAIVQALDFKASQPLNLKRIQYKTQGETEYEAQMRQIDQQIEQAEKKKQELRDRFNKPTHKQYVSPDLPDYDQLQKRANDQVDKLDAELKRLRKSKLELAQKKGQMASGGLAQMDIFAAAAQNVNKKVDEIRQVQNKPERKRTLQKGDELADTYQKVFTEKEYINSIRRKLDLARQDKVKLTEAEIIEIGIAIRPLIQSFRGALIDVGSTNKRVLAPTLNNLLRWAQKPGRYDLVGVDIAGGKKPTVIARKVKRARIFNLLGLK